MSRSTSGQIRVVQELTGAEHGQTLQRAKRQQVGDAGQVGEVALEPGLLVGTQPLVAVVVVERQKLRHAAPDREMIQRLHATRRLAAEQPRRLRVQDLAERLWCGDEAIEQRARAGTSWAAWRSSDAMSGHRS